MMNRNLAYGFVLSMGLVAGASLTSAVHMRTTNSRLEEIAKSISVNQDFTYEINRFGSGNPESKVFEGYFDGMKIRYYAYPNKDESLYIDDELGNSYVYKEKFKEEQVELHVFPANALYGDAIYISTDLLDHVEKLSARERRIYEKAEPVIKLCQDYAHFKIHQLENNNAQQSK